MKAAGRFSPIAKTMRDAFVRFAPFNVLALIWAACLIWYTHVPGRELAAHRLSLSLAYGACWGMLSALAARLVVERRGCRVLLTNALPAFCGVTMAVLGSLLWHHVLAANAMHPLWVFLYFGSLVSLGAFAAAQLFGSRNAWTVFGRLFLSAVFVGLISLATFLGILLCLSACDRLIVHVSGDFFADAACLIWCAVAPAFMAAMLPKDNEPTEQPKTFNVLFWFLIPIGMALLAILYVYVAKIVVTWSMPSGKMNWFASCAIGVYLFFWLSLRGSSVRLFHFVARWGWLTLLPVVATQIVGIAIRYSAYGLTMPRMAGMATLAIGIYALVLAALDRSARSAFILLAVAGMLLTVSPFNIVDVPIRQQSARLRSALERAGCLVDGRLLVPKEPNIPVKDAKAIVGAWKYLTERRRLDRRESDTMCLRPSVWYHDTFTHGIVEAARKMSGVKRPDLPKMLNINSPKFVEKEKTLRTDSKTTNAFHFDGDSGALDISGYKKLETVSPIFGWKDGKYFLALSQRHPENRYDVTAHVEKLLANSGAAADSTDGEYHSFTLRAEDAIWDLAPDLAIAVTRLTLYRGQKEQSGHLLYGYILRK